MEASGDSSRLLSTPSALTREEALKIDFHDTFSSQGHIFFLFSYAQARLPLDQLFEAQEEETKFFISHETPRCIAHQGVSIVN
jgi:hypothetical protein